MSSSLVKSNHPHVLTGVEDDLLVVFVEDFLILHKCLLSFLFIFFFFVLRIFSSCRYARRCLVTISLCELGLESTKVRSFGLDTIVSSTGVT